MKRTLPNISDKILAKTILRLVPRWITPNHVTIFRFISIPFVIYFLIMQNYAVALPLFAVAAFTDALDGAMARTRNQITEWGKLFDPMADKILIATSSVILIAGEISFLLAILMVSIDAILAFTVAYQYNSKKRILNAHWTGKTKMVLQCLGIAILLLSLISPIPLIETIAIALLYLAVCFGLISLFIYRSA